MAELNLAKAIEKQKKVIKYPEQMIGTGLLQPFNNANSGSRKLMLATHLTHRLPLVHSEIPLIQTGFENEFGYNSSSYIDKSGHYRAIKKIAKFSNKPNIHYALIYYDIDNDKYDVIERVEYEHITESYGYMLDNQFIDSLKDGQEFNDQVIQKSTSYDEYNNHKDGVNLTTLYLSCDGTMEDSILLSESGAKKLVAPLLKTVSIIINDNDIMLNMYGDDNVYKPLPDIGEDIKNGILCAIRREKKEESLFTQSCSRLKDIMMSDDKFTLQGKVVDINVYCNNKEALEISMYNSQINKYYQDYIRFATEFVNEINSLGKINMTYELKKLYTTCKRIVNGTDYIRERPFSNIIIDITVLEYNEMHAGDKLSDRYGGKGVVSKILPDSQMPLLPNGEPIEIIFNMSTCVNRLNPGQLFETSLNHIGSRIIDMIDTGCFHPEEAMYMIIKFISMVNRDEAKHLEYIMDTLMMDQNEIGIESLLDSYIKDGGIILSLMPISSGIDIDTISNIYDEISFMDQLYLLVPQESSNGKIRYIKSRRPVIAGKKYIYRLKQYAEEKFSATSLSATNIRNENSRSKANKSYKSPYPKTPIRFGVAV